MFARLSQKCLFKPKFKFIKNILGLTLRIYSKIFKTMSDYKRVKCPECGNENPRKLHEENDKSEVLYFSMQGTPVYKKLIKCGDCGFIFKKE